MKDSPANQGFGRTTSWFMIFGFVIVGLVVVAIITGQTELISAGRFRWTYEQYFPEEVEAPELEITPIGDIVVQSIEDTAMKVSPSDNEFPITVTVERVEPYNPVSNCKYYVSTTRFIKYERLNAKVLEANETHVECEVKIV